MISEECITIDEDGGQAEACDWPAPNAKALLSCVACVSCRLNLNRSGVFGMNRETKMSVITGWSYNVLCGLQQEDGGSENWWRPVLRPALEGRRICGVAYQNQVITYQNQVTTCSRTRSFDLQCIDIRFGQVEKKPLSGSPR